MRRLFPNSLLGRVLLVTALGLLIGQAIAAVLLFQASELRRETGAANQIVARIISAEERIAERRALREEYGIQSGPRARRDGQTQRRPRRLRIDGWERSNTSPLMPGETRHPRLETTVTELLVERGHTPLSVVVTVRRAGDDPQITARPRLQARLSRTDWAERKLVVAGVERADGTGWDIVRQPLPQRPSGAIGTIIFQTLVIFTILLALLYLVLRQLTRPLAQLTRRVGDFSENPDQAVQLEERGPQDIRRLIAAHNALEQRISSLLDEKDVMLGAIGHDLKTPLAALRVRIESVPNAEQKERMAASIDDITNTLDDILELARIGRPSEGMEVTELSALVASVVVEYEDMGEPVKLGENPRIALPMRATLMQRAIRNLIDNALRYGKQADLCVEVDGGQAIIRIEDKGPGIPAQQISAMLEPFQRGEASRNRATGGAGLGLTLARAITQQHGGILTLSNLPKGGLRAEIKLTLAR